MDAEVHDALRERELTSAPHDNRPEPSAAAPGGYEITNAGLAAERTLLAWVRTSLAMMGFGFVVAKFGLFLRELAQVEGTPVRPSSDLSLWIGGSLVVLGVVVNVVAAASHIRNIRGLHQGKHYRSPAWSFGVLVTLSMATIGVVLTAYLCFWGQ